MPEPTKAPSKVPAGLKKKLGPLPRWAWLALIAVAVAVWYFFVRGRSEGGGEPGAPLEVVTGSRASTPLEQAYGGYPSENGSLAGQIDPGTLSAIERAEGLYSASYEELRGNIKDVEDALESYGWSFEDQQITPPSGPGSAPTESYDPVLDRLQAIVDSFGGVQASPGKKPGGKVAKPPAGKSKPKPKPKPAPKPKSKPKPKPKPKPAPKPKSKPKPAPKAKPKAKQPAPRPRARGAGGGTLRSA